MYEIYSKDLVGEGMGTMEAWDEDDKNEAGGVSLNTHAV